MLFFLFFKTILSKIVTIHGLYLMALWHPQAPLGGISGSGWTIWSSALHTVSARGTPLSQRSTGMPPSSCNMVPLQNSTPRAPSHILEYLCSSSDVQINKQINKHKTAPPHAAASPSLSHPHTLQMLLHRDKPLAFSLPASNQPLS